jgi:hypothetical protein
MFLSGRYGNTDCYHITTTITIITTITTITTITSITITINIIIGDRKTLLAVFLRQLIFASW